MSKSKISLPIEPPQQVDFRASGLGILRSTGELIVLLLMLEDPYSRADILAHTIREMGIDFNLVTDLMDRTPCPKCHLDLKSLCARRGYCEDR